MLNTLTSTVEDNEGKPRLSHPLPSDRLERNVHPNQRNLKEGSFVFPSSSGEESSVDKHGKMRFGMVCKKPFKCEKSEEEKFSASSFGGLIVPTLFDLFDCAATGRAENLVVLITNLICYIFTLRCIVLNPTRIGFIFRINKTSPCDGGKGMWFLQFIAETR